MKKLFMLFIFSLLVISVNAQIRKIPSAVTDAFKEKFPNAEKVEWKDKLTYFEASFNIGGTDMTADFSHKGEWQETDKTMSFDDLSGHVKDGLKKSKYADWTPGSVAEIKKKGKDTQYRIYVEKSSLIQKKFLYFNKEGKLEREAQTL